MNADDDTAYSDFHEVVNMTAHRLQDWLETDESKQVGQKKGGSDESTGHQMGRRIVDLLDKKKGDLSDKDREAMRKVVGYVRRHTAQRPDGDITDTAWRYSLMNWGHDPTK